MDSREVLREIVSKLSNTPPDQIGADFSMKSRGLESSARRAALGAAIRRKLGGDHRVPSSIRTFGELEQLVFGKADPTSGFAVVPELPAQVTPAATAFTLASDGAGIACGVDIQDIAELPEATDYREHEFYRETFSPEEIAYCVMQENPRMHFAARWCAKEALYKCDPAYRQDKMAAVELVRTAQGEVFLRHLVNGIARRLPHAVSISHTDSMAAAFVVSLAGKPGSDGEDLGSSDSEREIGPVAATPASSSVFFSPAILIGAWLLAVGLALAAFVRTF